MCRFDKYIFDSVKLDVFVTALAFLLLVLIGHNFYVFHEFPFDDAFIHMRLARNFAENGVPVFNLGESVMGGSSQLWLGALAMLFKVFGASKQVVSLFGFSLVYVSIFLYFRIFKLAGIRSSYALFFSTLVFAITALATTTGLMETPLTCAVLAGGIFLYQKNRLFWSGVLFGLCVWTRYEYSLILPIVFLFAPRRMSFLMGAALPIGGLVVFSVRYFGRVIPQTVSAKSIIYDGLGSSGFVPYWDQNSLIEISPLVFFGGMMVLGLLLIKNSISKILILFSCTLGGLYYFRNTFMFDWYWPNIFFPLLVALILAGSEVWMFWKKRLAIIGVIIILYANPLEFFARDIHAGLSGKLHCQRNFVGSQRVQRYLEISEKIHDATKGAILMTSEIGGLGWGFLGMVLDGAGLVTPDALKHHPMKVPEQRSHPGIGAIPLQFIIERRPHYVISMPIFIEEAMAYLANPANGYRLIDKVFIFKTGQYSQQVVFPDEFWGSPYIYIYKRMAE